MNKLRSHYFYEDTIYGKSRFTWKERKNKILHYPTNNDFPKINIIIIVQNYLIWDIHHIRMY